MGAKYLYGKVVFNHDTTLLILMNENGLLSYKLFDSLMRERKTLPVLRLTKPLPDHRREVVNLKNESKVEKAVYFRNILESSSTKNSSGDYYFEILSIEII
jgi:hypothetical protein